MKADIVHQYYKDPETGVEMHFSKRIGFGWSVNFPKSTPFEALYYKGKIPWPALSTEEQAVVDENYKKLHKMLEEDDETDN